MALKSLQKKIVKHSTNKAHIIERIRMERIASKTQRATGLSIAQYRAVMEKCLRTAYFIAKEDCPHTDYEAMLDTQERNSIEIGITLHSRWSCTGIPEKGSMGSKHPSFLLFRGAGGAKAPFLKCNRVLF